MSRRSIAEDFVGLFASIACWVARICSKIAARDWLTCSFSFPVLMAGDQAWAEFSKWACLTGLSHGLPAPPGLLYRIELYSLAFKLSSFSSSSACILSLLTWTGLIYQPDWPAPLARSTGEAFDWVSRPRFIPLNGLTISCMHTSLFPALDLWLWAPADGVAGTYSASASAGTSAVVACSTYSVSSMSSPSWFGDFWLLSSSSIASWLLVPDVLAILAVSIIIINFTSSCSREAPALDSSSCPPRYALEQTLDYWLSNLDTTSTETASPSTPTTCPITNPWVVLGVINGEGSTVLEVAIVSKWSLPAASPREDDTGWKSVSALALHSP